MEQKNNEFYNFVDGTPLEIEMQTQNFEQKLNEAERKAQEHYDAWVYAKAETENVRKRSVDDMNKTRKFAIENLCTELLSIVDSLEVAIIVESQSLDVLKNGIELTHRQLIRVFDKFNIVMINPIGDKLDPHKHQVIGTMQNGSPLNTILSVVQRGYALNDRLLRPALVVVSNGESNV